MIIVIQFLKSKICEIYFKQKPFRYHRDSNKRHHSSKILFKSNLNEIFLIHWHINHDNDRTKNRFSTW